VTWSVIRLGVVGSTNDEAAARARKGAPHGTVLVADGQTKGRGQKGRSWQSPAGSNIYLSVILRPDLPPSATPPITLAAGVATCDTVNHYVAGASIKWPNDVLWSNRKMAGILTEASTRGTRIEAVILGVGLNVNQIVFRDDLPATSLSAALGAPLDREQVLVRLLGELERWTDTLAAAGPAPVIAAWRARAGTLGRRVRGGVGVAGVAVDVDETGALVVMTDDGTRVKVSSGLLTQEELS
jgi:BirA family transcriptional regulator, biotin operon repressor / biotin---[acetyl-CoA-carboxylase] ligase